MKKFKCKDCGSRQIKTTVNRLTQITFYIDEEGEEQDDEDILSEELSVLECNNCHNIWVSSSEIDLTTYFEVVNP